MASRIRVPRGIPTRVVGAMVAFALAIGSVFLTVTPSRADDPGVAITDNAWVRWTTPGANYGTGQNLVIGKDAHTYIRLDVSPLDAAELASVTLNLTKYNNAANVIAVRASEFLTQAGVATTTPWTGTTVTYNTRPLDIPGSPTATATVPQGNASFQLDITALVTAAKADGGNALTLHLITDKQDDISVSGTDIYSTRASNATTIPWVQVTRTTDEPAVDYPIAQRFGDYLSDGRAAQDVVRIAAPDGRYLAVNEASGAIGLTATASQASLFAIYGYDYTASEYDGTGGGQQTSYAIKSLSNGKYLTIQNYGTGAGRPYYLKTGSDYVVAATAPSVQWNERFSLKGYPAAGTYAISSHLDALRDGSEAATSPVQAGDTSMRVVPGDRRTYLFRFEPVDAALLEVQHAVRGTSAELSWLPVAGDTDPAHYTVAGSGGVSYADGLLTATVPNLAAGAHTLTVSYAHDGTALSGDAAVRVFRHPGVSLTEAQLDAVRDHVAAKAEPWYSDYLRLANTTPNGLSSLDYEFTARVGVGRGSPQGSGNIGDWEESAAAAYHLVLQWVATGDDRYAAKGVEILNAWSSTLTQIDGRDQILGAALATLKLINAAEILRYHDGGFEGYAADDFAAFQRLMLEVVYPVLQDGGAPMLANGNWDVIAMATLTAIAVVTDNGTILDDTIAMYESPYINGSLQNYVTDSGQTAEAARDQAHGQLGVGALGDLSAIAYNQGVNLWALEDNKLARAFNWAAQYNLFSGEGSLPAEPVKNIFGRTDIWAYWDEMEQQGIYRGQLRPIYENALAYYSTVDGVDVTWMERAARAMRPEGFVHFDNLNFDTLTTYNGPATEKAQPYFQLRTMLTPWYQTTWTEVGRWGAISSADRRLQAGGVLPAGLTTETLDSYFAVQPDGSVAVDAMQKDAPYFRLVTNEDDTYSIRDVASGKYLGVTETVVDGENLIAPTTRVPGAAEKFQLRNWGIGRFYLVHDGRLVKVSVDGSAEAPRDAALTLRLGTQPETANRNTGVANWLLFTYVPAEQVGPEATPPTVAATTRCVAGKVVLAVTVGNASDAPVPVTITSDFGSKAFEEILPGRSVSAAFST
ncbi:MAG TPA: alginate lyase family protein, partial [Arachnia sp.]|nr:alginate lyase family protein [Arachnia sp.]HMT87900.1 alginate lyase family protein [Arachnia sp.]